MGFVTSAIVECDMRRRCVRFSVLSAGRYRRMEAPPRSQAHTQKQKGFIALTIIGASFSFVCPVPWHRK